VSVTTVEDVKLSSNRVVPETAGNGVDGTVKLLTYNPEFVVVTNAGIAEARPHLL
jgi:hypothetical protein